MFRCAGFKEILNVTCGEQHCLDYSYKSDQGKEGKGCAEPPFPFHQFTVLCLDALDLKKCLTLANLGRFGIKGSGLTYEAKFNWANWTRPVANWVCGYEPYLGVVIYDCIPEDKVPLGCF